MSKNFFGQLFRSVSSPQFYQELATRRFSEGMKYFSLLILFVTLVLSTRFSVEALKGLSEFETWSKTHLPEIVIEKGVVSVNAPQPWRKEEGHLAVIIDTTGQTRDIDDAYAQGVLLTRDKLILKRGPYETRRYDLSKIESFRLNARTVERLRRIGQWILPPLLTLFLFVYFWLGRFSQIVVFSAISLLTNWFAKKNLSYGALLTIGMYAITPPLLLFSGIALLGIQMRLFDMIYLSSYAALLVTAVLQSHPRKEEMADETMGGS